MGQEYESFPLLPISYLSEGEPSGEFAIEDEDDEAGGASGIEAEAQGLLSNMSSMDEKAVEAGIHDTIAEDGGRRRANSTVVRKAKAGSDAEHKMSLREGLRLYPKAIAWSCTISLLIAMEAFDLCLLNTFCTGPLQSTAGLWTNLSS